MAYNSDYNAAYRFSGKECEWQCADEKESKKILGGKGAALVKMVQSGLNVPPGFTFTTQVCHDMASKSTAQVTLAGIKLVATGDMKWLKEQFGYTPLVSVRSGAPVSMPGMMDTILNVGLNKENIGDWCDRIGVRPAYDSYRRLIQMLGSTAYGVKKELFDEALDAVKQSVKAEADTDLDSDAIATLCGMYEDIFQKTTGKPFPQKPIDQLMAAIKAVFNSWHNERAVEYRKLNKIDPAMGTACTVQAMVFGNMGDDCGTGVLFSRDPSTGEKFVMGEFLQNAQGEDVVAGIRTPLPINVMPTLGGNWQAIRLQINKLCAELEKSYKDMVDIEFTVQKGELFVLQSRSGKRSARAAFKIAHDLAQEGVIDPDTAMKRLTREQYKVVRQPSIDPAFKTASKFIGLPACPGVVSGRPVFSSQEAVECKEPCILVTHETTPDDIKGMNAAMGILTKTGGATCHAAVVARAMDKACVVGCTALDIDWLRTSTIKKVTIDGASGKVWYDVDVPVIDSSDAPELRRFVDYALEVAGAAEQVTLDVAPQHKQMIMTAHWWGNKDVFDSVLLNLANMPSRANVTINLCGPKGLEQTSLLHQCFGWESDDANFLEYMIDRLTVLKEELHGLKIMSPVPFGSPLTDAYVFVTGTAMPADYAVFSVLAA
ncbi:PEP/pyruvate-binding domain-containing protein [Hyphomicrobium sp. ghe19]|uniref:PEP/pyruvate-binding domain-containing protein n=1 Tax=Hyphomicrobium sp. ghe19 TaxID=2682968 RepID=UPI0013669B40|nr:Pyruvate, phosphate dikinase [Hyphomicrobium sp. ghe19]